MGTIEMNLNVIGWKGMNLVIWVSAEMSGRLL